MQLGEVVVTSKDIFEDEYDLIRRLEEDIEEIVPEEMENIYFEQACLGYDKYSPKHEHTSRYRDGIDGSFADFENYKHEIKKDNNSIKFSMYNDRISDCNCSYCNSNDTHLDKWIDDGVAGNTRITPKNTTEETQRIIDETLEDKLIKKLNERGW